MIALLQETTTAARETTVVLDPRQVELLIEHSQANTHQLMFGLGFLLLFLSVGVFIVVNQGRM